MRPCRLFPRSPERGLQPLPLLFPTVVLGSRTLLERLDLCLDFRRPLRMLALGFPQRRLRLGRRLLAPFAILLPGRFLAPALGVTALLLLLEFRGGLSGVPLADLRRLPFADFVRCPSRCLSFPADPRSDGRSDCSAKRPPEPAGRFSTTPGFDIVAVTTSGSSVSLATP